ncbi:MAG: sodium-translocating pyrophosphatase [Dehalococcoidia bacterium]|jgi:K(+)-stimulated pyrophosphate-energized sodium pump|nr:sodium-translocating pyrophosphatase [Chloroflexota bacterium]RZP12801.1 MAG: sodium-translocating pyrophosphatase [Chloroflexota bacterium]|tara:strand:+ start:10238 stop:12328 length:2091 start_codon:yes stop_codon:yes gene_type:complete
MSEILYALIASIVSLIAAGLLFLRVQRIKVANQEVQNIGNLIHEGAMAFLKREYTVLSLFVIAVFIILIVFIDLDLLGIIGTSQGNINMSISYLLGAIGSALAGYFGMAAAVRGNSRTTEASEKSLNNGLKVAFSTGAVPGFAVVGIGLLGVSVLYMIFESPTVIAGFGFGASSVGLFARVAGGVYTKAADVGADLVGKVEAGLPEDDPRNPATIADNVGDMVGDTAGMSADLFESYAGSLIATIALAVAAGTTVLGLTAKESLTSDLVILPLIVSSIGILASIIGFFLVRTKEGASMNNLLWSFRTGIFGATILGLIGTGAYIVAKDMDFNLLWVILFGNLLGIIVGTATEYFTSYEYKPVKWMASQSETGAASVIIAGIAVGLYSTVIPAITIAAGILISFTLAGGTVEAPIMGLYGIALASVGMLSTLAITLSTDSFGPVSDNAGGIAEQAGLDPEVRERTDALDSLGNTTAATGKGISVTSAVLTSLALLATYATVAEITSLNLLNPKILVGAIIGGLLPFIFAGLTMAAVGRAAGAMIEEVRRQFREIKGLREGKKGVKPDVAKAVEISTNGALKEMIIPGTLAILAPIIVGIIPFLGPEALGSMLAGSIISGFLLAIFLNNFGGAADNAKKYIELGNHGGKGSAAHEAGVIGDTVGDPTKDTSGPALNILLKLMAMVSIVFGPLFLSVGG